MASPEDNGARCVACNGTTSLKRCARCHTTQYCSAACQKADWKSHKPHYNPHMADSSPHWYHKHRQCQDDAKHEGRLELITWSVPVSSQRPAERDDLAEDMGWGNCVAGGDSDALRQKFEVEFAGSEERLFEYWPQGFRGTCCGLTGMEDFGCDHHGRGSTPCSCDFCKMGKAIPNSVHDERTNSPAGKGLKLSRGPDPRSISRGSVGTNIAEMMRGGFGFAGQRFSGMRPSCST